MSEINFGIDAQTGSRFFESQDGEYLQLIPHDGDVAALVWTMGDVPIYSLIEEVAKNYGEYTNRLCGMVEYSDGEIVALHSSKEALVRTRNQERSVRSLMVGFDDILIKLLSADQVRGSAPVDSEYDQVSIIGHRGDFLPVVDKWINITASPTLGKNAVRIAELLG